MESRVYKITHMKYFGKIFYIVWISIREINKIILSLFYNRKYLSGRYYDYNTYGWKFAWKSVFFQKILGFNRHVKWPVSMFTKISKPCKILFDNNDSHIFYSNGCYFQSIGEIVIGAGTYIAPNVGLITSNHDISNLDKHSYIGKIIIGKKCWIGMNSVILPDTILGDNTVVGAGAVVKGDFSIGNCIIAGVPAKIIKRINQKNEL